MTRKTTVTFTLSTDAHGNVALATDLAKPTPGAALNAAQLVALELINYCQHQGLTVTHGTQAVPALSLVHDITQADGYAYAVPASLWRAAIDVVNRSQHAMAVGPFTPAELDQLRAEAQA
ncbi:hypothetical protein A1D30_21700 [Acidovorax sp. GW101-3H11]|uniref:hypothetical protein n=1 Tax=Acidovorax sp. GW101-3H11 TaxID=1813946 RepID=UPI0007B51D1E|nr:hypothetical protein [Acidovorax sp. GW101-3H11]KZT13729.1 hypothetical protein A1D30_21700 [Acidovorax sp. GW101-3H11]